MAILVQRSSRGISPATARARIKSGVGRVRQFSGCKPSHGERVISREKVVGMINAPSLPSARQARKTTQACEMQTVLGSVCVLTQVMYRYITCSSASASLGRVDQAGRLSTRSNLVCNDYKQLGREREKGEKERQGSQGSEAIDPACNR
eukprot:360649-Chlamydomonas_euryale.AAC.2